MNTLSIIIGSTRPQRFGPQVAQWIHSVTKEEAEKLGGFEVKGIDLEEVNLPFLDESKPASYKDYSHRHTKDWSEKIESSDGFIFISPEYNHSYSGVLKNAIDYLFHEWNYKPLGLVTYGGGAGGGRAAEHLRGIAGELKMYDLREQVMIPNYWEQLNGEGLFVPTEAQNKSVRVLVKQLVFWMDHMKKAREAMFK